MILIQARTFLQRKLCLTKLSAMIRSLFLLYGSVSNTCIGFVTRLVARNHREATDFPHQLPVSSIGN
jgi:hypothetical protein